jgi:enoyl-CoA hydratase/carnithine racemase
MNTYDNITLEETEPGIAVLTLNRPDRLNAFDMATVTDIHGALTELEGRIDIRVLILTGAGRAFCAGTDLKAERGGGPPSISKQLRNQKYIADMILRMRRIPQPIVAAVNGVAAGGGFSLSMASDVRVASETARFICSFINVGISSGDLGSSYFLPRLIGLSRAADLLYTGRPMDAAEAERVGYVSRVVPDGEALNAATETARVMLGKSPFGLRMTKEVVNQNIDAAGLEAALHLENRTQTLAVTTGDFLIAAQAFQKKEQPTYQPEEP